MCVTCDPNKKARQKTSEMQMKTWLTEQGYTFEHDQPFPQTAYRPDFLFRCDGYLVVVENDERAHQHYGEVCERHREKNIRLAAGVPVVFIRYNPDGKNCKKKEKLATLKATLDKFLAAKPEEETLFLFYPDK